LDEDMSIPPVSPREIEQIGMDQTSNVEDEETDDDNIPLNKLYKHRHTTITKQ